MDDGVTPEHSIEPGSISPNFLPSASFFDDCLFVAHSRQDNAPPSVPTSATAAVARLVGCRGCVQATLGAPIARAGLRLPMKADGKKARRVSGSGLLLRAD